MADSLFDVKIHYSLNGRSNKDTWSNTFCIAGNIALESEALKDAVTTLVTTLRPLHTTDVFFLRASIKQRAENLLNKPANKFRKIPLTVKGSRTPMAGLEQAFTAPLELAVEVNRDPVNGRGGILYLRGCVGENEVSVSANNEWDFIDDGQLLHPRADIATAIAALDTIFDDGIYFCIPDKVDTFWEQVVQHGREIETHRLGGLIVTKRSRKRVSAETDLANAAQRIINRNVRKMQKLAQGVALSALEGAAFAAAAALMPEIAAAYAGLTALEKASVILPRALTAAPQLKALL